MSALSGIAQPLDPDLDLYVVGMLLSTVQSLDNEFIVGCYAEHGEWDNGDGMVAVDNVEMVLTFGLSTSAVWRIKLYSDRLERWRDNLTPLTMCSAPNRLSCLMETSDCWLPIPRGAVPHHGEGLTG